MEGARIRKRHDAFDAYTINRMLVIFIYVCVCMYGILQFPSSHAFTSVVFSFWNVCQNISYVHVERKTKHFSNTIKVITLRVYCRTIERVLLIRSYLFGELCVILCWCHILNEIVMAIILFLPLIDASIKYGCAKWWSVIP